MKGCVLVCEYEIGFLLEYILTDSGALRFEIGSLGLNRFAPRLGHNTVWIVYIVYMI